jgi:hypothetical protein
MKTAYRLKVYALAAAAVLAAAWMMGLASPGDPPSDADAPVSPDCGATAQASDDTDPVGLSNVVAVLRHVANLSQTRPEQQPSHSRTQAMMRRLETKERVVLALAANRMSLLEAARIFYDLDGDGAAEGRPLHIPWPDSVTVECYCRLVIHYARGSLMRQPEALAKAVIGRLEAEFREHVNSGSSPGCCS